jgi:hypothetical protein
MKNPSLSFICLLASFSLVAANTIAAPPDTGVLDHPVAVPAEAASPIYRDHVEAVRKMAAELGKKLVLPEGPLEFLTKFNGGNGDVVMGWHLGGKISTKMTIRDYFAYNGNASLLMVWKYDALRDAIVLDFPWHKTNFRDGRTLIDILKKRASSKDLKPEEWDEAFDELLSRPDNFPQAWKPRIIEDNQSLSGPPGLPGPVYNFFTGVLKDAEGKEHLLVLNLASHDIVPSDVFLICYLFDAKGNWEEGGECGGGGQFAGRKVKLDEKGQVLSYDITSNAPLITYNFTVQAGKLGFAVLEDGKPLDPAGYKNAGVTPFRDLGDL